MERQKTDPKSTSYDVRGGLAGLAMYHQPDTEARKEGERKFSNRCAGALQVAVGGKVGDKKVIVVTDLRRVTCCDLL